MGRKKKVKRYSELAGFENAVEEDYRLKGKWRTEFFKNNQPITAELGCGRGEYTIELAQRFPEHNFIGIDIKGARLWQCAKYALEARLTNVGFLRIFIDHIPDFFAENELDEIWITFPDPYLKYRNARKRLTSPAFLDRYRKILKKNGLIHLKTDSDILFNYTCEVIKRDQLKFINLFPIYIKIPLMMNF